MSDAVSLRPPKYRRHEAKGLAVVTLDGRDHYLGEYGAAASQEAYRRLTAEWLLAGGKRPPSRQDVTVAEVLAAYLRFAKGYYVKNGEPTNEVPMLKRVIGMVKRLYGRELAADLGPLALKACRQQMIEQGWCRNQVNKQTDRVKMASEAQCNGFSRCEGFPIEKNRGSKSRKSASPIATVCYSRLVEADFRSDNVELRHASASILRTTLKSQAAAIGTMRLRISGFIVETESNDASQSVAMPAVRDHHSGDGAAKGRL